MVECRFADELLDIADLLLDAALQKTEPRIRLGSEGHLGSEARAQSEARIIGSRLPRIGFCNVPSLGTWTEGIGRSEPRTELGSEARGRTVAMTPVICILYWSQLCIKYTLEF